MPTSTHASHTWLLPLAGVRVPDPEQRDNSASQTEAGPDECCLAEDNPRSANDAANQESHNCASRGSRNDVPRNESVASYRASG